ncbi:MAG TPA: DMT family transporter [Rubrobacteraceae bacterium]|nr:DMT family transporter [Rubrobacteraceae bacterium]
MSKTRDRVLGALAVAAAASMWGTLGYLAKLLYAQGVSFEALVAFRAVFGWFAVAGFLLVTQGVSTLRVGKRDLLFLFFMGLFGVAGFYLFYFYTVQESTIGTAAILLYSFPALVVILARIFLGESLTPPKILALILTVGGVFLVAGAYDPANLEVNPFVLLTGLLAALCFGLYPIFGKPVTGRLNPSTILSYALAFGAMILLVTAIPTLDTLAGLPPGYYVLLLLMAIAHTAFGYALYTFGIRRLEAGQVAIIATLEAVVAGILGAALLGETLTFLKILGGLLVLSGAALAQIRLRKPRLRGYLAAQEPEQGGESDS